jgi:DNA polymerase-3 subunit alpha
VESLVAAGALDSLPGNRAQKTNVVETILEFGQKVQSAVNNVDLFAAEGGSIERKEPEFPDIPEWSLSRRLSNEKSMLGFYVSGHPLDQFRNELKMFGTVDSERIIEVKDGREVRMGGIISAVKVMNDKRGNRMAFMTLEDFKGTTEIIVFSDCFDKGKEYVEEDSLIMVSGRVSTKEEEAPKILATEFFPLEALSEHYDCQMVIKIDSEVPELQINDIIKILESSKGTTPVVLATRRNGDEYIIKSKRFRVTPNRALFKDLKSLLGDSAVFLQPQ